MSIRIYTTVPKFMLIRSYDFPTEEVPPPPSILEAYNKHRDGGWPTTDRQRQCIKLQKDLFAKNVLRLYRGFQIKFQQRLHALGGDKEKAKAEAGAEVMAQYEQIYWTQIWEKDFETPKREPTYLVDLYRYWRDISSIAARMEYDRLWEYVAGRPLPLELMTFPGEFHPRSTWRPLAAFSS